MEQTEGKSTSILDGKSACISVVVLWKWNSLCCNGKNGHGVAKRQVRFERGLWSTILNVALQIPIPLSVYCWHRKSKSKTGTPRDCKIGIFNSKYTWPFDPCRLRDAPNKGKNLLSQRCASLALLRRCWHSGVVSGRGEHWCLKGFTALITRP